MQEKCSCTDSIFEWLCKPGLAAWAEWQPLMPGRPAPRARAMPDNRSAIPTKSWLGSEGHN